MATWSKEVFAQNLLHYMNKYNKTQKDIADIVGVSAPTVNDWIKAKKYPRIDKIEKLANYFGILKSNLIEEHTSETTDTINAPNIFKIETKKFPLLGNIACGEPVFANEEMGLYIEAGANIHADFCLKASGDSMIGARIHDGDIVFIRQQSSVEDGEIAAVLIDDEATLKRVYYDKSIGILSLFAENPKYKALHFRGAELDKIRILGKAVAFQSDIR